MVNVAPLSVVDGPTVAPLRFGLFSVSTLPEESNGRWQNGVTWESEVPCDPPGDGYGSQCESPAGYPLQVREGQDVVEALPFTVFGSYRCKTFSKPLGDAQARALNHLIGWEERMVERAVMHGDLGNSPSFQSATNLTGAGAVPPDVALNRLEEWLGTSIPGVGVLHVPRSLAGTVGGGDWVSRQGPHLETVSGTQVAVGAGYDLDHVGPSGATPADGERWVFATSKPVIRRGEVYFTPQESNRVDTVSNDVSVLAHRTYVVGWDCAVAAALVDTGATSP